MPNTYEDIDTPALVRLAETISGDLRAGHSDGAADFVQELAQRLADCDIVQALASEGIGQRAPVALLLVGRDSEMNVAAAADALAEQTLNGFIVLEHCPPYDLDEDDAESMRLLLNQKIEMADVVCIVNVDGIDEDLVQFIDYAENHSKPVQYTNPDA